jgi:hypothetical protein
MIGCGVGRRFRGEKGADEKEDEDADGMWEAIWKSWYMYIKPRGTAGDLLAFKTASKSDVVLIDRKGKRTLCYQSVYLSLCYS